MQLSDEIIKSVYRKDYVALNELLRQESSVNSCDRDGRTPLMHAVLADDADSRLIEFLIETGANLNAAEKIYSYTALHFAAQDQKAAIVSLLLDRGAEVECVDSFGNTPLWRAAMKFKGDAKVIKALLAHGANPRKKNHHGVSALDTAQNKGNPQLVELLSVN